MLEPFLSTRTLLPTVPFLSSLTTIITNTTVSNWTRAQPVHTTEALNPLSIATAVLLLCKIIAPRLLSKGSVGVG